MHNHPSYRTIRVRIRDADKSQHDVDYLDQVWANLEKENGSGWEGVLNGLFKKGSLIRTDRTRLGWQLPKKLLIRELTIVLCEIVACLAIAFVDLACPKFHQMNIVAHGWDLLWHASSMSRQATCVTSIPNITSHTLWTEWTSLLTRFIFMFELGDLCFLIVLVARYMRNHQRTSQWMHMLDGTAPNYLEGLDWVNYHLARNLSLQT